MAERGKLGDGTIKIAIAVEIPPELVKSVFRWLLPIGMVLAQYHIFSSLGACEAPQLCYYA